MELNTKNIRVEKWSKKTFVVETRVKDRWQTLVLEGHPLVFATPERAQNRCQQLIGMSIEGQGLPKTSQKPKKRVKAVKKPVCKKKVAPKADARALKLRKELQAALELVKALKTKLFRKKLMKIAAKPAKKKVKHAKKSKTVTSKKATRTGNARRNRRGSKRKK